MKPVSLILISIIAIVGMIVLPSMYEYVDASEIVLVQSLGGNMAWHTSPGPICQCLGTVTSYPRRGTITFTAERTTDEQGRTVWSTDNDNRLGIQFYDGAKGKIFGSLNFEPPTVPEQLTEMHSKYPTPEALADGLIKPALNKTIYMTGPLMSSHESYKERRTELITYVEDQVQNGVYLTDAKEVTEVDTISGERRLVMKAEIRRNAQGQPVRAEQGQLLRFGVKAFNFAIEDLDYEEAVDAQIAQQQTITMAVQTAIANSKKADQDKLTADAQGAAKAATAKWEQETLNAKIVAEAEGMRKKAEQEKLAAEFTKQKDILLGQGEAERKRLVMSADGALEKKLDAYVASQKIWADALAKYQGAITPTTVMGSGAAGGSGGNAFTQFMDLQNARAVRDLNINNTVK